MFSWLEEFYRIRRESRICETCEVLKLENARLQIECNRLIDRILEKPVVEQIREEPREFKPVLPRNTSWNVKRQMLEEEDRRKAQLLKQNEKVSTDDLEKELDIVTEEREKANGV